MSGYFLLLPCLVEISVFNANNADPDQTPRSVASDLGLHCLPMPLLWDARCTLQLCITLLLAAVSSGK